LDIDSLLQECQDNPDSFPFLVEHTVEEAYRRVGGDSWNLLRTYQCMLDHLDEVRPGIRFWDWFRQIAGPDKGSCGETLSGPLLDELKRLRPESRTAPRFGGSRLGETLARATQSGLLGALAASTATIFSCLLWFGGSTHPVGWFLALFCGTVMAQAIAFVLGPLLGGWRRWRSVVLRWLALAGLALLSVLASERILKTMGFPRPSGFDEWLTLVLIAICSAFVADAVGRFQLHRRPWLLYRGDNPRRRRVAWWLLATCVIALAATVTPTLIRGWSIDPAILAVSPAATTAPTESPELQVVHPRKRFSDLDLKDFLKPGSSLQVSDFLEHLPERDEYRIDRYWWELARTSQSCRWILDGPSKAALEPDFLILAGLPRVAERNPSDSWLAPFARRRALNDAWREFQSILQDGPSRPWTLEQVARLRKLHPPGPLPRLKESLGTSARARQLAHLVITLELRRLSSHDLELPKSLDQLSPYFDEVAEAYRPWLRLQPSGEGLELVLLDEGGHELRAVRFGKGGLVHLRQAGQPYPFSVPIEGGGILRRR
jgi:hypothetical protein